MTTDINHNYSPEFFVNHARGIVLSEMNYSHAFQTLTDCSLDNETVIEILKGNIDIEDSGDGMVNLFEVEESKYKNDLNYIYRNYLIHNGQTLKAYAIVNSFGYIDDFSRVPHKELTQYFLECDDAEKAINKVLNYINAHIDLQPTQITDKSIRALHYADDSENDVVVEVEVDYSPCYILCKTVDIDVPDFLNLEKRDLATLYKSLLNFKYDTTSIIRGYKNHYMWYEDEMFGSYYMINKVYPREFVKEDGTEDNYLDCVGEINKNQTLKTVKQQVLNDPNVIKEGFLDLKDYDGNFVVKVPKLPFLYWSLKGSGYDLLPEYQPYSPSGMKMNMDCRYHSDWMIAADLDLNKDYNSDSKVYNAASNISQKTQSDILDFECNILSYGDKQRYSGDAFVCEEGNAKNVKQGDVLIMPRGSFEFDEHIRRATKNGKCAMITANGSKDCHVAVVSREMQFICFNDPKVLDKVRTGVSVVLLPEKGRYYTIL